jgi:phage recombination protein Bet
MANDLALYSGKQLDLIRRTVAADANHPEFDLFIHTAKHLRLDPLRRQIYCFIFSKDNAEKRKMSIVTAIDGYRTIAARTNAYRPDNRPPRIVYDADAVNPDTNPLGIVRAEVSVFKHSHGEWHEVVGEAYWEEYAPIKEIWENGRPSGRMALDKSKKNWRTMPRVMISKCAEAQAIRRGWPDDVGGAEIQEEVDRRTIDLTATELADEARAEAKLALVGGKDAVTVQWDMSGQLARVPMGKLADEVLKWANANDRTETEMRIWWDHNLPARTEYKARHGAEYFEFHKAFNARASDIEKRDTMQAAE